MVDVNNALAVLMAVKEDSEINTIKKACQVKTKPFPNIIKWIKLKCSLC